MKDEDRKLFRELMGGVKLHQSSDRVNLQKTRDSKSIHKARQRAVHFTGQQQEEGPLTSLDYIDRIDPYEVISFRRDGLQHSIFKNLRLGKMPIEADLDLHSHTVDQA